MFLRSLFFLTLITSLPHQEAESGSVATNKVLTDSMERQILTLVSAYNIGPDPLQWPHSVLTSCTVLPKHIAVRYSAPGVDHHDGSFIVILSKENGNPFLLQLTGSYSRMRPILEQHYALSIFNSIWTQEGHSKTQLNQVDWMAVASCFASLTGDEVQVKPNLESASQHNVLSGPFAGLEIVLPLIPKFGHERSMAIVFDKKGLITKSGLTIH